MSFNQIADGKFVIQGKSLSQVEKLEPGTYAINLHPELGYYVERVPDFILPAKIYGDNPHLVTTMKDRFLEERVGKVTTAVLSGLKGSGKTLAAKQFATQCRNEKGICTFLVSRPYAGQGFNAFLTELQQAQKDPIIVLIDEFEKIYTDQSEINALLTLLDGTATLHMAVMLTMNTSLDERRFEFFKNRPGRAYFNKHFETCPEKVIREYCQDNLQHLEKLEEVVNFSYRFNAFTLDLLTTLVKEINLTKAKVSLDDICNYINIKPDVSATSGAYVIRSFNNVTRVPLSVEDIVQVNVDYDFAEEILHYRESTIGIYARPENSLFPKLHAVFLEHNSEKAVEPTTLKLGTGVSLEACFNSQRTEEKDAQGDYIYKRSFTHYKLNVYAQIQHPDEPDECETGTIGTVDYASRKITFAVPFVDLDVVIESRNRRVDESRRLVL